LVTAAKASPDLKTVDDAIASAKTNQDTLIAALQENPVEGSELRNPGAKTNVARVTEKAATRTPAGVTDIVRAGFVVNSPEVADKILAGLSDKFAVVDEGWVTTPVGYTDRKALIGMPNGQIAEVQFWSPQMIAAKDSAGHALYEQQRALPAGDPKVPALIAQQRAVYGAAAAAQPAAWKAASGNG
jgi:hypothetical protein